MNYLEICISLFLSEKTITIVVAVVVVAVLLIGVGGGYIYFRFAQYLSRNIFLHIYI